MRIGISLRVEEFNQHLNNPAPFLLFRPHSTAKGQRSTNTQAGHLIIYGATGQEQLDNNVCSEIITCRAMIMLYYAGPAFASQGELAQCRMSPAVREMMISGGHSLLGQEAIMQTKVTWFLGILREALGVTDRCELPPGLLPRHGLKPVYSVHTSEVPSPSGCVACGA